jgi:4-hydroxy-2-oxoheptanedioate aldolase
MTMAARNTFKAALRDGRTQLGIWSSLCSPIVAEILAQSGFDWVMFDAEHSPVEISGLLPLLQAAGNGRASVVVRPPWNDSVLAKRVLDLGAQNVLFPFVQSPEEAAEAVRNVRYPPHGRRGVAGATRASGYGRQTDYHAGADAEICVLVQVETGEALAELETIAATPGVDGVFVGPSDLSASMGHLGRPGHPSVQREIERAAKVILAAGKAPGILASGAADARRYLDWGYRFVACASDIRVLANGVDTLLEEVRGHDTTRATHKTSRVADSGPSRNGGTPIIAANEGSLGREHAR